jgi:hypothetical protein
MYTGSVPAKRVAAASVTRSRQPRASEPHADLTSQRLDPSTRRGVPRAGSSQAPGPYWDQGQGISALIRVPRVCGLST